MAKRIPLTILILALVLSGGFFGFYNVSAQSGSITATVQPVYARAVYNFDTTQSSSQTFSSPNGTSLNISLPADVLTSGEEVKLITYSIPEASITSAKPLPSGKLAADTFYNFSFTKISDSSAVTSFDQSVTLTFYYTDSDISGIDESTLGVYRWSGSAWSAVTGSTIDTALNKVTVATQQFSDFGLMGSAPSTPAPAAPSSGGGGGGGGYTPPVTQVILQGLAYPGAELTILKDGQVAAGAILADSTGNFKVSLAALTAGIYTFGVWAEDGKGRKSTVFSFTVTVQTGLTTIISNIFLPPTIELDKVGLKKGEVLNILGQSVPASEITIKVESSQPIIASTTANKSGDWNYPLSTAPLEDGTHFARAKANLNGLLSSYSNVLTFNVGKEVAPGKTKTADANGDNMVNLVDFSILLYNWGTPKNIKADLNGDGWVNLTDFSIMMYQWTG